ncbi:MAG: hypothetical protein ABGX22_27630 [Pirellulaceae bacterium]
MSGAENGEVEGEIVAVSADGKGVPMRSNLEVGKVKRNPLGGSIRRKNNERIQREKQRTAYAGAKSALASRWIM